MSSPAGVVWQNLKCWVEKNHAGYANDALELQDNDKDPKLRGVFATKDIPKGECLMRVPESCVVSGASCSDQSASSWLKCVAAYYKSKSMTKWKPYFESLPQEYETLFQWTDDEIQTYLAGTTVGEMVQLDRKEGTLEQRYRLAVRPFLRKQGLIDFNSDELPSTQEMQNFLNACMCISTRGFHLSSSDDKDNENNKTYRGPFLLPIVDLLNHDPPKKCTTLQRQPKTGVFTMVAERNISAGEEIFHSYGDTLTAAQLLQTFGFVPLALVTDEGVARNDVQDSITPVVISKTKHLLPACEFIKSSNIPVQLRANISTACSEDYEEGDFWDVDNIPSRPLTDNDVPEDWLFSSKDHLSDELITLVVLQFIPQEAYNEMVEDGRITAWLDRSILEDNYLAGLVLNALLEAAKRKASEYIPVVEAIDDPTGVALDRPLSRDRRTLNHILESGNMTRPKTRTTFGLKVRIEELISLENFVKEVTNLFELHPDGDDFGQQPSKRIRAE